MIHELHQPNNRKLALECKFPEALAVIEGNNPGWVCVDDLEEPSAALVWAQGIEGFYLVGDPACAVFCDELDAYTEWVIKPRLYDLRITWVEICGNENWDPVIERIYKNRFLESGQQCVYRLKQTKQKLLTQRKEIGDCWLKKVDRHLLVDFPISNKEFLFSKLTQFWGSVARFMKSGLGYVLLDEEEIVSLCFSSYVAGNIHVIDIETIMPYRGKGYAEIVAQAFVADCIEMQLQPYWDCMAENIASIRLAEKLGFTFSHGYSLYSFSLK